MTRGGDGMDGTGEGMECEEGARIPG